MAIIGEIRKHYWLLVAIIGVALLLFVLSDFQRKSTKHTTTLAVIAGEKLAITEFNKKLDDNIELQKANSGKENITAEETVQIRQSTWQQVISEIVMNKQYEELGIMVSVDELADLITGNNPHQAIVQSFTDPKTGKFDKKAVTNFIQNLDQVDPSMKERYLMMEKGIKNDRLNTKYNSLITKGLYVPTAIAKRGYLEANNMAKIRIAGVRYQTIPDSTVAVTDADFEKYYNENKYKFKQENPARDIEFVMFEPRMSAEDMQQLTQTVKRTYEDFLLATDVPAFVSANSENRYDSSWKKRGSFAPNIDSMLFSAPVGKIFEPMIDNEMYRIFKVVDRQSKPDSLRASHILISYAGTQVQGVTRSREEAIKLSDSLFDAVKKAPATFEAIAGKIGDDEVSRGKNGDLGWFADGSMVQPFNKAVLEGTIGDIVKVETQFGYHIIKIAGKKDPSLKIKVASVDFSMEPGSKTLENLYNEATAFATKNKTYESFQKAGKTLNLRSADRLSMNDYTIPGLKSAREVVRWAFNEETEKGDVSNVFDVDGTYVVAALKNKVDKGIIPLEVIKEPLKPLVIREKKAEMMMKKVNDKFATSKDVNALLAEFPGIKIDTADVSFASANIPNFGHEPVVTGQIFVAKPAQVTGPIKGEQGVFVFILDQKVEAPAVKDYENQKKQMAMYFQSRVGSVTSILQEKAEIKDNRLMFF